MKRCGKCGQWKPKSEFNKDKNRKDGLQNRCKQCQAEYHQKNREWELAKMRKYRETHRKERVEYCQANKEQISIQRKKYRKVHKKAIAEYNRQHRLEHREEGRKDSSKQRGLGYNPLNEWFEGSETHHINNNDVVFIPKEVHRKFRSNGHNLEYHRNAILNYYGSIERMINNNPIGGAKC